MHLADWAFLEKTGEWDLELQMDEDVQSDDRVERHVQQLLKETAVPVLAACGKPPAFSPGGATSRPSGTGHLNQWRLSTGIFVPHVPGFWDHIPPESEKMIGPDDYLLKVLDVFLGVYTFHWCRFVLKKQIILAMWRSSMPTIGDPKVFWVLDNVLKGVTETIEFRRMAFYLSRWFTAYFVAQSEDASQARREPPNERQLKLVLDCQPSEGSLLHLITLLAFKCGMEKVKPRFSRPG
ncbi:hypothetical protein EYF80_063457 [Liparis tanakae]|uniref:Uncharacterized protein n=1 Tax=Liparis tanakae TaxID=230148 RepID=A0A4Z2ECE6_9TELE|nr:hypothetical protein EYF80_063457 [Liparis tanakae]